MSADKQLHRHTARYPTTDGGKRLLSALEKLQNREIRIPRRHPEYSFLNSANFGLKGWTFDGLMDQGRKAWVLLRLLMDIRADRIEHGGLV